MSDLFLAATTFYLTVSIFWPLSWEHHTTAIEGLIGINAAYLISSLMTRWMVNGSKKATDEHYTEHTFNANREKSKDDWH